MQALLEASFQMPVLPATMLLLLVTAYWLLAIIGIVGIDLFDFDLDFDTDVNLDADLDLDVDADSFLDSTIGLSVSWLTFLNIGKLPLTVWLSAFSIIFWVICRAWPTDLADGNLLYSSLIVLGSAMIALLPTKLVTQPFRGMFEIVQPESTRDIIGREGEVITAEISQKLGQVRITAESAPLLLNARSVQGVIGKGEIVRIVKHSLEHDLYLVERVGKKSGSEVN